MRSLPASILLLLCAQAAFAHSAVVNFSQLANRRHRGVSADVELVRRGPIGFMVDVGAYNNTRWSVLFGARGHLLPRRSRFDLYLQGAYGVLWAEDVSGCSSSPANRPGGCSELDAAKREFEDHLEDKTYPWRTSVVGAGIGIPAGKNWVFYPARFDYLFAQETPKRTRLSAGVGIRF